MSNHLFDFKSFSSCQFYEINSLENNQISIDDCSKIMILNYEKKNPFVIINLCNLQVNENNALQIYQNILNQTINLNIPFDFNFDKIDSKILQMIVSRWLSDNRTIKYVPSLIQVISEAILYHSYKIYDTTFSLCSEEFLKEASANNFEILEKIKLFFDSIPLFFQTIIVGFITSHLEQHQSSSDDDKRKLYASSVKNKIEGMGIEIIDDIEFLPKNIISLFYNQKFLLDYYSNLHENCSQKFFLQQFTSYMYNGFNLYYYFHNENNIVFNTVRHLGSSVSNQQEMSKFLSQ